MFTKPSGEAQAAAQRTDGNYVYAVAGAMETDLFIGELVDRLTQEGLLEDTVLIFYADHYDYYMMDDPTEHADQRSGQRKSAPTHRLFHLVSGLSAHPD